MRAPQPQGLGKAVLQRIAHVRRQPPQRLPATLEELGQDGAALVGLEYRHERRPEITAPGGTRIRGRRYGTHAVEEGLAVQQAVGGTIQRQGTGRGERGEAEVLPRDSRRRLDGQHRRLPRGGITGDEPGAGGGRRHGSTVAELPGDGGTIATAQSVADETVTVDGLAACPEVVLGLQVALDPSGDATVGIDHAPHLGPPRASPGIALHEDRQYV